MLRGLAGDHFEMPVEAGEIIETALKTQLFDTDTIVDEQFAGVPYPYLGQELRPGLARAGFEITAKGIGNQAGNGGHFFQVDLLGESGKGIVIDRIDAIALEFRKIVTEPDGGKKGQPVRSCKGRQTFDQGDDPFHSLRTPDLFYAIRYLRSLLFRDQYASPGLIQEGADGFGLGKIQEGIAPEIFRKMDDGGMHLFFALEPGFVISPVMGEVGSDQDDIAGMEALDMIPYELGAPALVEIDQFQLRMIMPAVVDKGVPVFPDAERVGRGLGNFE